MHHVIRSALKQYDDILVVWENDLSLTPEQRDGFEKDRKQVNHFLEFGLSGWEKSTLNQLGGMLNDILMNPEAGPFNATRLRTINEKVYAQARKLAGVTSSDLADENQENSPRVCHYWSLTSLLLSQVYMSAANQLASYEDWNR